MNRPTAVRGLPLLAAGLATLLALALPSRFLAAQPAVADTPQFPLASRIGLTPPPGMTLSTKFQGFEDETNNIYIR